MRAPPRPETIGEALARYRALMRPLVVAARQRLARSGAPLLHGQKGIPGNARSPAPPAESPTPPKERSAGDRLPIGSYPITSLAENAVALLALPTRDVRGFWRFENSRGGERRKRVFYEIGGKRAERIEFRDRPRHWWPIAPLLAPADSPPSSRPAGAGAPHSGVGQSASRPAAESGEVDGRTAEALPAPDDVAPTVREIRTRLCGAIRTLIALDDREWRFLAAGNRVNWPATVADCDDLKARAENDDNKDSALRPERFRPTRRDLSDMDEPLEWFRAMNLPAKERGKLIKARKLPLSHEQKLVWWAARGVSIATVAKDMGVSDETARRRTNAVFERLARLASGASKSGTGGRLEAAGLFAAVAPRAQAGG